MSELLDEIAALKADNQKLKDDLKSSRGQHAWATRKARDAENAVSALKQEIVALRASETRNSALPEPHTPTTEHEPDLPTSIFELHYPELMRAARLIRSCYAAGDGELAAVGNRMLKVVADMCEAVEPRRKGRRAA